jgi:beta-glucosidase
LALQLAREGIVLLKNENSLLPLDKNIKTIAVIGPNADHKTNQLGDYTSRVILQDIVTILDGIKQKVSSETKVVYVKGCNIVGTEFDEIQKASDAAKGADVAVVVLGENEWHAPNKTGTVGEGYDAATLELTGLQQKLVKAVYETGTPIVVVLISGRPLAIRWIDANVPAILVPWMCGEKGGHAVADVLFGDYNPSGRLPITFPRHVGQLPVYYNYFPSKKYWLTKGWGHPYADMNPNPLYVFGFGLSYTKFTYSNLIIEPKESGTAGRFMVSVDVKNIGQREGDEVVQLYIRDVISSVTTPVKKLVGFQKVSLKPGEAKTVTLTITSDQLAILDQNLRRVVEPGTFNVMVGSSSKDIHLAGSFLCN